MVNPQKSVPIAAGHGVRSKHFQPQELAAGIFAALATPDGAGVANAGLIDLGGQTLVFDTFLTPQAARDLRLLAEEVTGRAPDLVVNSHYHNDHIWGNQVFLPEAQFISSDRTRQLIQTLGKEELAEYSAISPKRLKELREQYEQEPNPHKQSALITWIAYYEGLVEALPTLRPRLPAITFEKQLSLHGETHSAHLTAFERGHTGGDTVLYLPEAGILFMSDLLFVGCHPYLADGDPLALRDILVELQHLDAHQFVPGHGPVGGPHDLRRLIDYIDGCLETARSLPEGAGTDHLAPPPGFEDWLYPHFYKTNIDFLRKQDR
jgi:cyclase